MSDRPVPETGKKEAAIVVCEECGTPARVLFEDGEIVKVLSPCGHVQVPEEGFDV